MLNWIKAINEHFATTEIWGLTSLYRLSLKNKDDWESPSFVVLDAGHDTYRLEYLMPESSRPWEYAYVTGFTKSLDEAMDMLEIAMRESEGWSGSLEL